ncbi:winged helix-turn-helix transcriptional regulator [Micromonospora sp. CA-263727]|uniref:winged helix-turn-helix transcriptional regulator n=1 Tax=Micromonospora sp. CA-263727 TaxID=3239967 RepID=UPI003D8E3045
MALTNDLEHLLSLLAKRKLSVAILSVLHDGPSRYSTLHHTVSQISPFTVHARTLTDTLNHLCAEGLVNHHQDDDSADYRLTAGGEELVDLLAEIKRWSQQHRASGKAQPPER